MSYNSEIQKGLYGGERTVSKGITLSAPLVQNLSLPTKFKTLRKAIAREARTTPETLYLHVSRKMLGIDYLKLVRCSKAEMWNTLEQFLSLLHCPEVLTWHTLRFPDTPGGLLIVFFRASETISGRQIGSTSGKDRNEVRFICISAFSFQPQISGYHWLTHYTQRGTQGCWTWEKETELTCSSIQMGTNVLPDSIGDTIISSYKKVLRDIFPSMYPKAAERRRMQEILLSTGATFLGDGGE